MSMEESGSSSLKKAAEMILKSANKVLYPIAQRGFHNSNRHTMKKLIKKKF